MFRAVSVGGLVMLWRVFLHNSVLAAAVLAGVWVLGGTCWVG